MEYFRECWKHFVDYAREISRVARMEVSSVHDAGKLLKQNEVSVTHINT
jgi:hypothetical protein